MHRPLPLASTEPSARAFAWMAFACAAFVVYGSLVPFHYRPLPEGEALLRWRLVCAAPLTFGSLTDWAQNVLLFIPLGFALMAAACVDRPWPVGLIAVAFVLPVCVLLSAAVEFGQLYFPPRCSSLNDVAAESIGAAVGALVWLVAGQRLTEAARRQWAGLATHGWAARVLPASLALVVVLQLLPLDLTLRPPEIYHKIKAGHVHLLPFVSYLANPAAGLAKLVWTVALFFPVGLLLARLPGKRWASATRVLLAGFTLTAAIEFMQLFVESRSCDTTDILIGTLAVLGGWTFAWRSALAGDPNPGWLMLGGWITLLVVLNWIPFNFSADFADLKLRMLCLSPIPFRDYQQSTPFQALEEMLKKIVLWVPVGALLFLSLRRSERGFTAPTALLMALAFAVVIEAGQLFLPTRWPSVTDVVLETGGAWLGLAGARRATVALHHGRLS